MNFLRKNFLNLLLIATIAFAGYVYANKKEPCQVPISYTLGSFDDRFGISKTDFLSSIEEASHVWENSYGKDLFEYTTSRTTSGFSRLFEKYFGRAPIKVNLVYDERQENANENRQLASRIDDTKQDASKIKVQFTTLQNRYAKAKAEYQILLVDYKNRRADWDTLEQKRIEVNTLADSVNALVKKYNYLVGQVNIVVDQVNQTAGQEFEEGRYVRDRDGERITIYEFGDRQTLARVLAHEFGHALGLDHNTNPQSIMYYLNNSKNMTPTKEDLAGVGAVCRKK